MSFLESLAFDEIIDVHQKLAREYPLKNKNQLDAESREERIPMDRQCCTFVSALELVHLKLIRW